MEVPAYADPHLSELQCFRGEAIPRQKELDSISNFSCLVQHIIQTPLQNSELVVNLLLDICQCLHLHYFSANISKCQLKWPENCLWKWCSCWDTLTPTVIIKHEDGLGRGRKKKKDNSWDLCFQVLKENFFRSLINRMVVPIKDREGSLAWTKTQ